MKSLWYTSKSLESIGNLRHELGRLSGRDISLEVAHGISVCLQQGRAFFESAISAPLEIKPLIVFYGMVGFAKAIYLSRRLEKLETLPHTHGLTDASNHIDKIEEFSVKIGKAGTFAILNDSINSLEHIVVWGDEDKTIKKPTSSSTSLIGKRITLKDILGRICDLGDLYELSFNEQPKSYNCSCFETTTTDRYISFAIHTNSAVTSVEELCSKLEYLRTRYSFLRKWRFMYESNGSLKFANVPCLDDNIQCSSIPWFKGFENRDLVDYPSTKDFDISGMVMPMTGRLGTQGDFPTLLVESLDGEIISETSLFYLGMFILSSIVRYYPHTWANAITRRILPNKTVDDRAIALIEKFVDESLRRFPRIASDAIMIPYE